MSTDREHLEEARDQALRDLVELDHQVAGGEIPPGTAAELRRRYEATAVRALAALDAPAQPATTVTRARPSRARIVAYALTALAAVLAAAVLLPRYAGQRSAGGFVTGNEVTQAQPGMSTGQSEAQTRAQLGWLLLQAGQPGEALRSVDAALEADASLLEARWAKANIQLYGRNDPAAALATLDRIRRRSDLPAPVAQQVDELAALARARLPGSQR